jgi:integrase
MIFINMKKNYDDAENKYTVTRPVKKTTELALWICLSTLCRIGELLKSEWQHINFEKRIWFIPAENTKGKRGKRKSHYVYLSDFSLNIFKQLNDLTGKTKWFFPASNKTESHVCEKSVSKQTGDRQSKFKKKTKALKNRVHNNDLVIGTLGWTTHDLRRTGSTIMQRLKVDTIVINKCQNHAVFGSAEKINLHYLHYQHEIEMVDAWEKLGFEIEKILAQV